MKFIKLYNRISIILALRETSSLCFWFIKFRGHQPDTIREKIKKRNTFRLIRLCLLRWYIPQHFRLRK